MEHIFLSKANLPPQLQYDTLSLYHMCQYELWMHWQYFSPLLKQIPAHWRQTIESSETQAFKPNTVKQNKHRCVSNLTHKSPPWFVSSDRTYSPSCPVKHALPWHVSVLEYTVIPNVPWCTSYVIPEIKLCIPWPACVYNRQSERKLFMDMNVTKLTPCSQFKFCCFKNDTESYIAHYCTLITHHHTFY